MQEQGMVKQPCAPVWGEEHPDLILLAPPAHSGICCLTVRGAQESQVRQLGALGAFYVYRCGEETTLLYAQDSGFAGVQALEETLRKLALQAGFSGPFALAASARGCMLKAQLALRTGRAVAPGRALYPMGEFGEQALVAAARDALARQGFSREDFADGALDRMAVMDAERDTQYLRSLDAYLSCGMDLKLAAQCLGVHRNTLAYRMTRLQAIFNLNLQDVNTCFELLFSLWLIKNLPSSPLAASDDSAFDARQAQTALWRHVERSVLREEDDVRGGFACVLWCVGVSGLADDSRAALLGEIRRAIGDVKEAACAYDEDALFVAMAPEEAARFEAGLCELAGARGCPVVATQRFAAGRMRQQARLCRMALCATGGKFVRLQDICSTLFFMAVERCVSLSPYFCEEVTRVMDDDAQKNTALSRSLYAYLLNFEDMKKAAQQLDMHRNTMEYHIRKIDAIIGEEAAREHRFMMMCTYKMLALPVQDSVGL